MAKYDERMMDLAGAQHWVISRGQLLEFGSTKQIDYRLRRGILERVHESVYRVRGAPPSWRQLLMAACFAGGKFSVASFRSAAQLWQLPGGHESIEITSPRWRRARHDGIVPHETRHLTELDITYVENIPVTRPARTLNDLGLIVCSGDLSRAELDHAMHDAVRRDLVDVAQVWRDWERLGGSFRPGGDVVELMLREFVPPVRRTDTTPELRLLQLIRDAQLPEPVPQFRVWLSETRWVDLDFTWPPVRIYAEFDPYKFHGDRDKYERDWTRRLELRRLGWDGLSVTDSELDAGAPLAMSVLEQMMSVASVRR